MNRIRIIIRDFSLALAIDVLILAGMMVPISSALAAPSNSHCGQSLLEELLAATSGDEVQEKLIQKYDQVILGLRTTNEASVKLPQLSECLIDIALGDIAAASAGHVEIKPQTIDILHFLAALKDGWQGNDELVSRFKEFAITARKQYAANPELVGDIDRALANAPNQLNAIVRETQQSKSGTRFKDKYERLLNLTNSPDYKGGPLEVVVYDLAAVAAEQLAIQNLLQVLNSEQVALDILREELELLRKAAATLQPAATVNTSEVKQYLQNDFRFRISLLRLLLDDRDWAAELRTIIGSSKTWDSEGSLDHIYVYAFVRWPPDSRLKRGENIVELKLVPVKSFFNPGQLALHLCMFGATQGPLLNRLRDLDTHLASFVNRDYRVFVQSSKDQAILQENQPKFDHYINSSISQIRDALAKLAENRDPKQIVIASSQDWSKSIPAALDRCGVKDSPEHINEIFSAFVPKTKGTWETSGPAEGKTYGLFLGDFLSKAEAEALGSELEKMPELDSRPFIARPRIDG